MSYGFLLDFPSSLSTFSLFGFLCWSKIYN